MALTKATYGMISADTSTIDLNIDANTLYVDSSANSVGIGTTSPLAPLDVVRGGTTGLSSVNARTALLVQNNLSNGTVLSINAKNTGYSGIFLGDQDNEAICQIQYVHTDDKLKFLTNAGGYNPLTISGQNVGIGTSSPGAMLDISVARSSTRPTMSAGTLLVLESTANTTAYTGMTILGGNATGASLLNLGDVNDENVGQIGYYHTNDSMRFVTAASERMRIDSSGNVGIGTTHPDSKLDVTGGDITVNTTGTGFMNFKYSNSSKGTISTDGVDLKITAVADLQLLPTGNVGIGVASPDTQLHVNGTIPIRVGPTSGSFADFKPAQLFASAAYHFASGNNSFFHFSNSSNAAQVSMDMANTRVGIGTSAPGYPLEISSAETVSLAYQRTGHSCKKWGFNSDNSSTYWHNLTDNVLALTLSNAGNATFTGTISSGAITSTGAVKAYGNSDTVAALEIYSNSTHGMRILHRGTDGDFSFERRVGGTNTEFLRIGRGNGNATFAGGITAGPTGVSTQDHRVPTGTGYITYSPANQTADVLNIRRYGTVQQKFDQYGVTFPAGNVGIGTASPASLLHVSGTSSSLLPLVDISNTSNSTAASCGLSVTGGGGSGSTGYQFRTKDEAGNVDFFIRGDGKVGIGTSSPSNKLHVAGVTNTDGIKIQGNQANVSLVIENDATNGVAWDISSTGGGHGYGDGALHFGVAFGQPKMKITSAGSVGIGTNTPLRDFDVTKSLSIFGTGGYTELMLRSRAGTAQNLGAFHLAIRGDVGGNNDDLKFLRFTGGNSPSYAGIAMQIQNSTGNVGIGETTPLGKLHVKEGDSGQGSVNSNFDQLVLEDDAHSGMTILSGTSSDGGIYFGDSGGNNLGQFKYKHGSNSFAFVTNNGTESLIIDSAGDVLIGQASQTGYAFAQKLVVGDGDNNDGITIQSGSTHQGNLAFNHSDGTTAHGRISYQHGTNYMQFFTNNTERMRIRSDGGMQYPTNNTFIATGTGSSVYEWGAFRRPASSDGGQLTVRQYSSGDTAANYPAYASSNGSGTFDENTGVYFPELDQVGLTANGNPTLTIEDGRKIEIYENGFTSGDNNRGQRVCLGGFSHIANTNPGGTGSGTYLHIKTNLPHSNIMFRFEYKGLAYDGNNMDTSIIGYTYAGVSYVHSTQVQDTGNTTYNFKTPYYSSDSKLVLVLQITNNYTGGILWAQFVGSHAMAPGTIAIASCIYSNSTSGAF